MAETKNKKTTEEKTTKTNKTTKSTKNETPKTTKKIKLKLDDKKKILYIVGGIVLVIVVIILLVFLLGGKDDKEKENGQNKPTQQIIIDEETIEKDYGFTKDNAIESVKQMFNSDNYQFSATVRQDNMYVVTVTDTEDPDWSMKFVVDPNNGSYSVLAE